MKRNTPRHIVLILAFFFCAHVNAQDLITPDSSFQKILVLDSMWMPGSKRKDPLRDSINYLELNGDRVEFRQVDKNGERIERGRIYRLQRTPNEASEIYRFYMVDRGAFKGSLTVLLQITGNTAELHITNPWSTYDRYFSGHFSGEEAILRPEKRIRKPKAHDRTLQ
jgi:hypothetical protein